MGAMLMHPKKHKITIINICHLLLLSTFQRYPNYITLQSRTRRYLLLLLLLLLWILKIILIVMSRQEAVYIPRYNDMVC